MMLKPKLLGWPRAFGFAGGCQVVWTPRKGSAPTQAVANLTARLLFTSATAASSFLA